MFDWLKKKTPIVGTVLFRGGLPPKADDFEHLAADSISVTRTKVAEGGPHWELKLRHPKWGEANVFCPRDQVSLRVPRIAIEYSYGLTPSEKETILQGESTVLLCMDSKGENMLHDRKLALRFLRSVMGPDGLAAGDMGAERFWSRDALDEELVHDADLDISQLYTLHVVAGNGDGESDDAAPCWLHSHGLDKAGGFDFDIVRPCEDTVGRGLDGLRALAFAILEGKASSSIARYDLGQPGATIRLVKAADFQRLAAPEDAELRDAEGHEDNRAVLCEPAGGLFGRFSRRVKPSKFFSRPMPDEVMFNFSTEASELMARRARGTYSLLRQLRDELAEFEFPTLVKLGYRTDGGGENDKEHLWFSVHECLDDCLDATLENQPFAIERMKQGQRGQHPLELMSDWTIFTPAGQINPRFLHPVRMLRAHKDELLAMMADRGDD